MLQTTVESSAARCPGSGGILGHERRTVSLVAERAVRYLDGRPEPVGSVEIARKVLSTRVADEATARRVLEAAFGGDPRLYHDGSGWRSHAAPATGERTTRREPTART